MLSWIKSTISGLQFHKLIAKLGFLSCVIDDYSYYTIYSLVPTSLRTKLGSTRGALRYLDAALVPGSRKKNLR